MNSASGINTKLYFLENGGEAGEIIQKYDWSGTTLGSPSQWPLCLRTTLSIVLHSSIPMLLLWSKDLLVFYNDAFRLSVGLDGMHAAIGNKMHDVWPERWNIVKSTVQQVMESGISVYYDDQKLPVFRSGKLEDRSWTTGYSPVFNDFGHVEGVFVTCTEPLKKELTAEKSSQRVRSLVESAPFPIGVYLGREMRIELANQSILDVWGKGNDVIGKLYSEILPELDNQEIFSQLDNVFTTGIPFHARNQRVDLEYGGELRIFYFNYSFTPLFDSKGNIYGVMNTAADVTDLNLAHRKLEQAESSLRGAVELAALGTFKMDITTGVLSFSDRLREWLDFEKDEVVTFQKAYAAIEEEDSAGVKAAVAKAIGGGRMGSIYDLEFTLKPTRLGIRRILHAQGKTFFDANDRAITIVGTVQNVTVQRNTELALYQLVQQRTEELETVNEELAATNDDLIAMNEEYQSINDDLQQTISLLERSNENLRQFAYVASHDLQEPLRKIQSFGGLLMKRYGNELGGGSDYVVKMQASANRMSALIEDLLTFSSVSVTQDALEPVSLQKVVETILTMLEFTIHENGAEIKVDVLPVIMGDESQLGQLFQNLLSNALKFRKPGRTPQILVSSKIIELRGIPSHIRPTRHSASYYQIDITDNGIGFSDQYAERIFQVFQRLHSKSEYAGTGIGLAICEKVVSNHGGAITASGEVGAGATFSLYFPV